MTNTRARRNQLWRPYWPPLISAVPFALVFLYFLCLSIMPAVKDYARMTEWVATDARVIQAKLVSERQKHSTSYEALAHYRYELNGRTYTNHRVAVWEGPDSLSSFQKMLGQSLQSAQNARSPITIWYNPNDPQDSVVDRSLPVSQLIFHLMPVLFCGGVILGLISMAWRYEADFSEVPKGHNSPWLNYPAWANNAIKSNFKADVWTAWIVTYLFNSLVIPASLVTLLGIEDDTDNSRLLILILPFMGLVFIHRAYKRTLNFIRYGDPILALDPFPGEIGGDFSGSVALKGVAEGIFSVELRCQYAGNGKSSTNEPNSHVIWQTTKIVKYSSTPDKGLFFRFSIPDTLPASNQPPSENTYYTWRLLLECKDLKPGFLRQYIVPIYSIGSIASTEKI